MVDVDRTFIKTVNIPLDNSAHNMFRRMFIVLFCRYRFIFCGEHDLKYKIRHLSRFDFYTKSVNTGHTISTIFSNSIILVLTCSLRSSILMIYLSNSQL